MAQFEVSSTTLRQGVKVKVIAGDIIPGDGGSAGVASVDESALQVNQHQC